MLISVPLRSCGAGACVLVRAVLLLSCCLIGIEGEGSALKTLPEVFAPEIGEMAHLGYDRWSGIPDLSQ